VTGRGLPGWPGSPRGKPAASGRGNTRERETGMTDSTPGTIITVKPHQRFVESLQRQAEANALVHGAEVSLSQVDRILTAETKQDIWDADEGGTVSGQDMIDVELEIRDYTVLPSSDEYDTTLGVYVNIQAVRLDTGEEIIVNTGADKIITKLAAFKAKGFLPIGAVIRGVSTRGGTMLKLRPLPPRAVSGTAE
jgi:hypothetical protein